MKIKKSVQDIYFEDGSEQRLTYVADAPLPAYEFTKNEVVELGETEVKINFVTTVPTKAYIEYWLEGEPSQYGDEETSFNFSDHTQTVKNLKPNSSYKYVIHTEDEEGNQISTTGDIFVTLAPITIPPTKPKKAVLVNCINWRDLSTVPTNYASELTYFVLLVTASGSLPSPSQKERDFIEKVKAAGKEVTFSIAGGTQNVADITAAVKQKTNLINTIVKRIYDLGYDGVTLDIENTNIKPDVIVTFINDLRKELGKHKIIGMYTQFYQQETVWKNLKQAAHSIDWLSPMDYDDGTFNLDAFRNETKTWETKVPKDKLMGGLAVNYQDGGVTIEQYKQALDVVIEEGWRGVGIWEHSIFTQPWKDAQEEKISVV